VPLAAVGVVLDSADLTAIPAQDARAARLATGKDAMKAAIKSTMNFGNAMLTLPSETLGLVQAFVPSVPAGAAGLGPGETSGGGAPQGPVLGPLLDARGTLIPPLEAEQLLEKYYSNLKWLATNLRQKESEPLADVEAKFVTMRTFMDKLLQSPAVHGVPYLVPLALSALAGIEKSTPQVSVHSRVGEVTIDSWPVNVNAFLDSVIKAAEEAAADTVKEPRALSVQAQSAVVAAALKCHAENVAGLGQAVKTQVAIQSGSHPEKRKVRATSLSLAPPTDRARTRGSERTKHSPFPPPSRARRGTRRAITPPTRPLSRRRWRPRPARRCATRPSTRTTSARPTSGARRKPRARTSRKAKARAAQTSSALPRRPRHALL
jgi:hypothetical protein